MQILAATLKLMLETRAGVGIPTLSVIICLPSGSCLKKAGSTSSTDENLRCSTCRLEFRPDCVTCGVCCLRNGPTAYSNSPKRRKEHWARRQHQVGGLPQPSALCRLRTLSSQSSGWETCPQDQVGCPGWVQFCAPNQLSDRVHGVRGLRRQHLHVSFLWEQPAYSHHLLLHTQFIKVSLSFTYKSLSACICMVCV